RALVPALVAMLGLVLVVSPLLAGLTGYARLLPDRAGQALYAVPSPGLTAPDGGLVLLGWIVAVGAAAATTFRRLDA
ncbi:hypothetical protein ACFQ0D_21880, partial [Micromonospora zhanjiangensis]